MKHFVMAAALACLAFNATAAATASATGSFNNLPSLVVDGFIPPESTSWIADENLWWMGQVGDTGVVVTLDFGDVFSVRQLDVSFDNNDTYQVDYSVDGNAWQYLWSVDADAGNVGVSPGGMDTLSSNPFSTEYASATFAPVAARYLRAFAVSGDSSYSIGEIQATLAPVPEPGSMALLLSGLFVIGAVVRRQV